MSTGGAQQLLSTHHASTLSSSASWALAHHIRGISELVGLLAWGRAWVGGGRDAVGTGRLLLRCLCSARSVQDYPNAERERARGESESVDDAEES